MPSTRLPEELQAWKEKIRGYAEDYGLTFFNVIFEVLDYRDLNMVASFGGFPTRYPHWRFGMEYEQLSKTFSYGLQKIYELVINTDPCYAYLMRQNSVVDQKLVMAHVYGHADFFKNNYWFSKTNRKMLDEMANHATRIRRYQETHGVDEVESFVDACLSLDNLIDVHSPFIKRRRERPRSELEGDPNPHRTVEKIRSKRYMDRYVNPPDFLAQQKKEIEEELSRQKSFPEHPERDVLLFLLEHAPLKRWQRDVLDIIREEAYYFAPQGMTKIMNEGWASYWHSKIMTTRALEPSELIDYASHHAGTMGSRPGVLNPYKIGIELFRDLEDRWNKGRFGKEWDECDDLERKRSWDLGLGRGMEKIFEVRKIYNDVLFIDEFLTPEFCEEHKLFTYEYDAQSGQYVIDRREFRAVKRKLLFSLTNFGQPVIYVEDGNHQNRGELYLRHDHHGVDLKVDYAKDTLTNVHALWTRPVHIETIVDKRRRVFSFDGEKHKEATLAG
ncbi:SpoVR family protein [Planctomycetota bacterium]